MRGREAELGREKRDIIVELGTNNARRCIHRDLLGTETTCSHVKPTVKFLS